MFPTPVDDVDQGNLTFDPYDHESYRLRFEDLKAAGQLQILKSERMQMLEYISMPESLWLDWLTELMNLEDNLVEWLKICAVAAQDCPFSIEVWVSYLRQLEALEDAPDAHRDVLVTYREDKIASIYRIALSKTSNNLKEVCTPSKVISTN